MDFLTYHIVVNWDPFSDILYSSILGFQARSIHPKKCVSDGQMFLLLPSSGQVEVEIETLKNVVITFLNKIIYVNSQ